MTAGTTCITAPGPRGDLLLGNFAQFRRDSLGLLTEAARKYGDVVRLRFGPLTVHLVNHPDFIEHVLECHRQNYDKQTRSVAKMRAACGESLLTADGEAWLRYRRLIQPAFHQQQLARFAPVIAAAAAEMLESWREIARAGRPFNVVSEMMRLTLTIAAQMLFGTDIRRDAGIIERALAVVLQDTWRRVEAPFDSASLSPALHRPHFRRALGEIDAVVYRIIEARRRTPSKSHDLLSILLDAHDAESETRLSDRELRDAAVTLLLAGHETTANALAWTFCLLAQSPEAETLLVREADQAAVTSLDAESLPYAGMVFSEAVRLYPSIWIIERRAVADDAIGGFRIPAGSTLLISPWVLHRHPGFWDEPERFDPQRFAPERCILRPRLAYVPYGAGPHVCIGRQMASLVARGILSSVYRQFRLRLAPGQALKPQPGITLRHAEGLWMTAEERGAP